MNLYLKNKRNMSFGIFNISSAICNINNFVYENYLFTITPVNQTVAILQGKVISFSTY